MFWRKKKKQSPQPAPEEGLMLALEPRIMLDGAALTTAIEAEDEQKNDPITPSIAPPVETPTQTTQLIIIDASVPDGESLVAGIDSTIPVHTIKTNQNGIEQITAILQQYNALETIHIFSHGSVGSLQLGNTLINSDTLSHYQSDLQQWGTHLTKNGDLLLYGCEIGKDESGSTFINEIARLTEADIAASTDITGNPNQGGDWELEQQTGTIESAVLAPKQYEHILPNTAPVLDTTKSPTFTATLEDAGPPVNGSTDNSTLVSDLINTAPLGNYSDADGNPAGIAVTSVDSNGSLWFTTNNGTSWTQLTGTVSDSSALLLAADANTRIYFQPGDNYNGTLTTAIQFKAWDQTSGINGNSGVDTSNPAPSLIGSYDTNGVSYDVTLSNDNNIAYIADGTSGLQIIDISTPATPTLVATFSTAGDAMNVTISGDGNSAYVAASDGGLQIIDVSNPATPSLISTYDTTGSAWEVVLSSDGETAYVTDRASGLQIIDISTPTTPTLIGSYDTPGDARGITLSSDENTAYIGDNTSGLQIIDISTPATPSLIGSYDTTAYTYDIVLNSDGTIAYVADHNNGLQIIDISTPASPTLIGNYDTTGLTYDVILSGDGNTAYIVDGTSGLQIVDISTPATPTLIETYDTTGFAFGITLSSDGNTAYVADQNSGLQIIDLGDPTGAFSSFSSNSDQASITITAVNDAPTLSSNNPITVQDGSTTTITSSYLYALDVDDLTTGRIFTVTTLPNNGELKLDGVALNINDTFTVSDIINNLVTYTHDGTGTASDTFDFSLADGGEDSALPVTGTFTLKYAPVLTSTDAVTHIEDTPSENHYQVAAPNITLFDRDSNTLNSATVTISAGKTSGDLLAFTNDNATNFGNISSSYSSSAGKLTLSSSGGTATVTQWQNALRAVTYATTNDHPTATYTDRTLSWQTADDGGWSNTVTSTITITPVNDSPTLTTNNDLHIQDGGSGIITSSYLYGYDVDDATTGRFFTITVLPNEGTLQLNGVELNLFDRFTQDDIFNNRVTYTHNGSGSSADQFSFSLEDGGEDGAGNVNGIFTIRYAPLLTSADITTYIEDTPSENHLQAAAPNISLIDRDSSTLSSATVSITTGQTSGDSLTFNNTGTTLFGNISLTANTGTSLTLSSSGNTATVAQWQNALRAVTYSTTNDHPTAVTANRTLTWQVSDNTSAGNSVTSTIVITPVNDAPTLTTNSDLHIQDGATGTITSTLLDSTDIDDTDASLTYTLTSDLINGTLWVDTNGDSIQDAGEALVNGGAFTQGDVEAGRVKYSHNGTGTTADQFDFNLQDGGEDGVTGTNATFTIRYAPLLTSTDTTTYIEDNPGEDHLLEAAPNITLIDRDSTTLYQAYINISSGYTSGDLLGYSNPNDGSQDGIYVAGGGGGDYILLRSSNPDTTIEQWQNALRSITFKTTNDHPTVSSTSRTITWQASDSSSAGNSVTSTIIITPTNDAPILTTNSDLHIQDGATATITNSQLNSTDIDDSDSSLTYTLTSDLLNGTLWVDANENATQDAGEALINGDAFTQGDIVAGRARYTHDGTGTTADQFNFTLLDGGEDGVTGTDATFTIRYAPLLTSSDAITYIEDTPSEDHLLAAAPNITLIDRDSTTLVSTTVTISTGLTEGDTLTFSNNDDINFGNLVGNFDSAAGILTLSSADNSATVAQWQNALRAITYSSSSDNPTVNSSNRTLTWQAADSTASGNSVTSTIAITALNDPPLLTSTDEITYIEDTPGEKHALAASPNINLTDGDDNTLSRATVTISAGKSANDLLDFSNNNTTNFGNIESAYDANTGILSLTSLNNSATVAQWQNALRAVTFSNSSDDPTATSNSRTLTWQAADTTENSNSISTLITITPVNDAPTLSTNQTITILDGSTVTIVESQLRATDLDDEDTGLTYTLTSTPANGTLRLDGVTLDIDGTFTQGDIDLGLLSYHHSGTGTASDTFDFALTDGGEDGVTAVNGTFTIQYAPLLVSSDEITYIEDAPGENHLLAASPTITLTDRDSDTLSSATVTISEGLTSGDALAFNNNSAATFGNISASYNSISGVLALISTDSSATVVQWQSALQAITFSTTNDHPTAIATSRTLTWQAADSAASGNSVTSIINITPVNDVPQFSGNSTITVNEDALSTTFSANKAGSSLLNGLTDAESPFDTLFITTIDGGADNIGKNIQRTFSYSDANGNPQTQQIEVTINSDGSYTIDAADLNALPDGESATTTFFFQVADPDGGVSTEQSATISISGENDAPVITSGDKVTYTEDTPAENHALPASPNLSLSDIDNATLNTASVTITDGKTVGDTLAFINNDTTNFSNISAGYNAESGVLLLSSENGSATIAQWQNALRAVTYSTTNDNPTQLFSTRTLTWLAADTLNSSNATTSIINITPTNDAPVISTADAITYTEDSPQENHTTQISPNLTVSDIDDITLNSASVVLSAGLTSGDVLAFNNTDNTQFGDVIASFDSSNGTLTLTSASTAATISQWQNALRAVTYSTTNDHPTEHSNTRTISWFIEDTENKSIEATSFINIIPTNDPPVISSSDNITYVEDEPTENHAQVASPNFSLIDDNESVVSASVKISSGLSSGDQLEFINDNSTNFGDIAATYNAASATLSLTSVNATTAQWQNALRAVAYSTSNDHPTKESSSRTLSWQVSDADLDSNTTTSTITIVPTNDAPLITSSDAITYTEDDPSENHAAVLSPNLAISDIDNTTLNSATVVLSEGLTSGDLLGFYNSDNTLYGDISASYDSTRGTLTLTSDTATATIVQWQNALQSVTYSTTNDHPTALSNTRTVTWNVSDNSLESSAATSTITIIATNDPPVIHSPDHISYIEDTPTENHAQAVSPNFSLTDDSDEPISSASVTISSGMSAGDLLAFSNSDTTLFGNITATFDSSSSILQLSSTDESASITQWQNALRAVTYSTSNEHPTESSSTRTLNWIVSDRLSTSLPTTSSITITPTNDAPVLTAGASITDHEDNLKEGITNNISNLINGTDIDDLDTILTIGSINGETGNVDAAVSLTLNYIDASGTNKSKDVELTVHANGSYTFGAANLDDLPIGNSATGTFTYTIQDDDGAQSNPVEVIITIEGRNDNPTLVAGPITNSEDDLQSGITIDAALSKLLEKASDIDDIDSTLQIVSINGDETLIGTPIPIDLHYTNAVGDAKTQSTTLIVHANGSYQIAPINVDDLPVENSAIGTFHYQVIDDSGALSSSEEATITITGVNDNPTLTGMNFRATEDIIKSGFTADSAEQNLLFKAEDIDDTNNALSIGAVNGSNLNVETPITVTFSYTDADGITREQDIRITVHTSGSFTIAATDISALPLGSEARGSFSYQAMDDSGALSTEQTSIITITGTNDAPSLNTGTITATEDQIETGFSIGTSDSNLLVGATDIDDIDHTLVIGAVNGNAANVGSAITTTLHFKDIHGADQSQEVILIVNADGSYTLSNPDSDTFTLDALSIGSTAQGNFTYQVVDDSGALSSDETATITISGSNDAPLLTAGSISLDEDQLEAGHEALSSSSNLLSGATDIDNNSNTMTIGAIRSAEGIEATIGEPFTTTVHYTDINGTENSTEIALAIHKDGSYTIDRLDLDTLPIGRTATGEIYYRVIDPHGALSEEKSTTITIIGTNDNPVITMDTVVTTTEDTPITLTLSATDIDSNQLSWSIDQQPYSGGTAILNRDNTITYTPKQDLDTSDLFIIRVHDDYNGTNTRSIRINIDPVNDPPILLNSDDIFFNETTFQTYGSGVYDQIIQMPIKEVDTIPSPVEGIAITGSIEGYSGKWQFSVNNGTSWSDMGPLSESSALLLPNTNDVRIRYAEHLDHQAGEYSLTVHAWDTTTPIIDSTIGHQQRYDLTNIFTDPAGSLSLDSLQLIAEAKFNPAPEPITVAPRPYTFPETSKNYSHTTIPSNLISSTPVTLPVSPPVVDPFSTSNTGGVPTPITIPTAITESLAIDSRNASTTPPTGLGSKESATKESGSLSTQTTLPTIETPIIESGSNMVEERKKPASPITGATNLLDSKPEFQTDSIKPSVSAIGTDTPFTEQPTSPTGADTAAPTQAKSLVGSTPPPTTTSEQPVGSDTLPAEISDSPIGPDTPSTGITGSSIGPDGTPAEIPEQSTKPTIPSTETPEPLAGIDTPPSEKTESPAEPDTPPAEEPTPPTGPDTPPAEKPEPPEGSDTPPAEKPELPEGADTPPAEESDPPEGPDTPPAEEAEEEELSPEEEEKPDDPVNDEKVPSDPDKEEEEETSIEEILEEDDPKKEKEGDSEEEKEATDTPDGKDTKKVQTTTGKASSQASTDTSSSATQQGSMGSTPPVVADVPIKQLAPQIQVEAVESFKDTLSEPLQCPLRALDNIYIPLESSSPATGADFSSQLQQMQQLPMQENSQLLAALQQIDRPT